MTTTATVHQLTEQFNELVAQARERGVASWATHHRSDFSSRAVAVGQLDRLRRELGMDGEVTLAAPKAKTATTPVYEGASRPHTVSFSWGGGSQVVEHRSMAPHWVRALDMALYAVERGELEVPRKSPPVISIREG